MTQTIVDTTPAIVEAGRVRRAWKAPLWAHAGVLAVIVLALFPVMRPTSAFTSDEGAYALQVAALDAGSWVYDYRALPLDPQASAFPIVLSDSGPDGYYPYVKHPAYPLLLQASSAVLGHTLGLHLFSLLGVVGAAVAAWLLAGELDPRLRRPAFWLAAGGPVLVNGFVIWAHAPSAALAGLALAAAARIVRRGVTPWPALGMAAALVAGVFLRSEGLLLAGALAVVLAAVRFSQTRRLKAALGGFSLAAGPALLALLIERWWVSSIVGTTYGGIAGQGSESTSFLDARLRGAWHVLFQSHFIDAGAGLPVLAALAVVAGGGFFAFRRLGRGLAVVVGLAVALLALRFAAHPHDPVTGLLAAWPVAVLGLLLFRWRGAGPVAWLLGGTVALFGLATLATQYPEGGGLEWGGRYLSPALVPLAVLAAAGLARAVAGVADESGRRRAVALLATLGVVSAGFAVATAGALRAREDRIIAAVERYPSAITVTTRQAYPRLSWRADDRLTWMLTDDAGLPDLLASLRAQGVREVAVLVGSQVPLSALSAYPDLAEQEEPALADDGMRMVIARAR
jgi:hypothetical protein